MDEADLSLCVERHATSKLPAGNLQDIRTLGFRGEALGSLAAVARVTLTRASIQSAKSILFVLTGANKRKLLEQAIKDGDSSPLPVGRVLAGLETPVDIHWCAE